MCFVTGSGGMIPVSRVVVVVVFGGVVCGGVVVIGYFPPTQGCKPSRGVHRAGTDPSRRSPNPDKLENPNRIPTRV